MTLAVLKKGIFGYKVCKFFRFAEAFEWLVLLCANPRCCQGVNLEKGILRKMVILPFVGGGAPLEDHMSDLLE